jgi:hypothetical protein
MNLHGTVDGMVVDDNAMTLTDLTVNTDGAAYAWAGTPERNVRHAGCRPGWAWAIFQFYRRKLNPAPAAA